MAAKNPRRKAVNPSPILAPTKVEQLFCYPSKEEFGGDYYAVEVAFDGKTVVTFGDSYHDKGAEKAEAFVQGVSFALQATLDLKVRDVVRENLV